MDGDVSLRQRMDLIEKFNREDVFLFLLTTRVGGLGINLTAANKVIIFDPDWNPMVDM
jgi:DNA excision repair protein ERCC-6